MRKAHEAAAMAAAPPLVGGGGGGGGPDVEPQLEVDEQPDVADLVGELRASREAQAGFARSVQAQFAQSLASVSQALAAMQLRDAQRAQQMASLQSLVSRATPSPARLGRRLPRRAAPPTPLTPLLTPLLDPLMGETPAANAAGGVSLPQATGSNPLAGGGSTHSTAGRTSPLQPLAEGGSSSSTAADAPARAYLSASLTFSGGSTGLTEATSRADSVLHTYMSPNVCMQYTSPRVTPAAGSVARTPTPFPPTLTAAAAALKLVFRDPKKAPQAVMLVVEEACTWISNCPVTTLTGQITSALGLSAQSPKRISTATGPPFDRVLAQFEMTEGASLVSTPFFGPSGLFATFGGVLHEEAATMDLMALRLIILWSQKTYAESEKPLAAFMAALAGAGIPAAALPITRAGTGKPRAGWRQLFDKVMNALLLAETRCGGVSQPWVELLLTLPPGRSSGYIFCPFLIEALEPVGATVVDSAGRCRAHELCMALTSHIEQQDAAFKKHCSLYGLPPELEREGDVTLTSELDDATFTSEPDASAANTIHNQRSRSEGELDGGARDSAASDVEGARKTQLGPNNTSGA